MQVGTALATQHDQIRCLDITQDDLISTLDHLTLLSSVGEDSLQPLVEMASVALEQMPQVRARREAEERERRRGGRGGMVGCELEHLSQVRKDQEREGKRWGAGEEGRRGEREG